jgi:hypothetical protein
LVKEESVSECGFDIYSGKISLDGVSTYAYTDILITLRENSNEEQRKEG